MRLQLGMERIIEKYADLRPGQVFDRGLIADFLLESSFERFAEATSIIRLSMSLIRLRCSEMALFTRERR
jgi:hypothetical protein